MGVYEGPPECDPTQPLVQRLRIAAERKWLARPSDVAALMIEAADEIERTLGQLLNVTPEEASHMTEVAW